MIRKTGLAIGVLLITIGLGLAFGPVGVLTGVVIGFALMNREEEYREPVVKGGVFKESPERPFIS